jgi:TolB-like protein/Flp pilus assembly protein TadD
MGVRLSLLGCFDLVRNDGGPMALATRKDRMLLAYLALSAARPQPRERLAGLLWSDRAEVQARDSLKQSLSSIRQVLRQAGVDPLRTDRDSVTFEPAQFDTDAIEFAALAMEPGASARAAALYRGELLESIDGTTVEFDTWLRSERERINNLALRVLEQLALGATGIRAIDDAVRIGRYLLSRDPLREPVYRALMRLSVLNQDRVEALKIYSSCREILKKELGVAPDTKTEELYRDILTDRPPAVTGSPQHPTVTNRPSIAILPFSNLSGDDALGYLCDGIAEDIITGLGRFRSLFVIDRHSSVAVAQDLSDVVEIGRRLGVAYLVQGSLQRQGERLRITVRLIDSATRAQLWGDAYDIASADILSAPDFITRAIVATLHSRVERSALDQSHRKPALAAYECVLRGIKHLRGFEPDDNRLAAELFQQAMDLDPDYGLARAYRAFADVVMNGYADAPDTVLANALSLAKSAVETSDDDSRCHWILAMIHGYSGNLQAEERHYQRALALNPNDANAIAASGIALAALGRAEEGIQRIREAMRLNPYHPEWYWSDLGMSLYAARRYADAAEALGQRVKQGPWSLSRIAACYAQMNKMEEAAAVAAEVLRQEPGFALSKRRLHMWTEAEAEHIREGMRKAGLPE